MADVSAEAAAARLDLLNTSVYTSLNSRLLQLEDTFVTEEDLAEDLDQVLMEVGETLDRNLEYVYGNLSLINATYGGSTFHANADNILKYVPPPSCSMCHFRSQVLLLDPHVTLHSCALSVIHGHFVHN